ncbi:MAG: hypothetical protein JWQ14_886 [Adhaeribacter sp.]|nr:hypothetical protein [Adhaeribacter sp.]
MGFPKKILLHFKPFGGRIYVSYYFNCFCFYCGHGSYSKPARVAYSQ